MHYIYDSRESLGLNGKKKSEASVHLNFFILSQPQGELVEYFAQDWLK